MSSPSLSTKKHIPVLHRRKLLATLKHVSLASIFSSCSLLKINNTSNTVNRHTNNETNNHLDSHQDIYPNDLNTNINQPIESIKRSNTLSTALPVLGHVVIVGGGFGGATAAKYLRLWGDKRIAVTLIERQAHFISCPMSNLILSGTKTLSELTFNYDGLKQLGVKIIQAEVVDIDSHNKNIFISHAPNQPIGYDRLILSPGVDFLFNLIEGFNLIAQNSIPHAWKSGIQTQQLKQQIESMRDGGTVAISIPKAPYRCPPGPYERACQIATYLKAHKPKSSVLILDANEDIQSKKSLFMHEWNTTYAGMIKYHAHWELKQLNATNHTLNSELGDKITADVINIIPPMHAGTIAHKVGVVNSTDLRWCQVDWLSMESTTIKDIHIIGDAVYAAPGMPKSGHMANQHGKIVASAIVELLNGRKPQPFVIMNTCYSYVDAKRAIHVASTHRFDTEQKKPIIIKNTGGLSQEANILEGQYAWAWAKTIWNDMLSP